MISNLKIYIALIVFFLSVIPNFGLSQEVKVRKATSKITVDGKANEKCWENAETINLTYFKDEYKAQDKQSTSLKMMWDEKNIYLFYAMEDKFINARIKQRDASTFEDDCAEIFFIPSELKANMHFCFEINALKTANDIVYMNKMYKGEKWVVKGYNPNYEVAIKIDGTLNNNTDEDKGWTMEMAIPIEAFRMVGTTNPVASGSVWNFSAIRQDRNKAEGVETATSTYSPLKRDKDVHNPKSFALMRFVD